MSRKALSTNEGAFRANLAATMPLAGLGIFVTFKRTAGGAQADYHAAFGYSEAYGQGSILFKGAYTNSMDFVLDGGSNNLTVAFSDNIFPLDKWCGFGISITDLDNWEAFACNEDGTTEVQNSVEHGSLPAFLGGNNFIKYCKFFDRNTETENSILLLKDGLMGNVGIWPAAFTTTQRNNLMAFKEFSSVPGIVHEWLRDLNDGTDVEDAIGTDDLVATYTNGGSILPAYDADHPTFTAAAVVPVLSALAYTATHTSVRPSLETDTAEGIITAGVFAAGSVMDDPDDIINGVGALGSGTVALSPQTVGAQVLANISGLEPETSYVLAATQVDDSDGKAEPIQIDIQTDVSPYIEATIVTDNEQTIHADDQDIPYRLSVGNHSDELVTIYEGNDGAIVNGKMKIETPQHVAGDQFVINADISVANIYEVGASHLRGAVTVIGPAVIAPTAPGTFAPHDGTVNSSYLYDASALFSGSDPLVYTLNGTLPVGLDLNSGSGLISGTPELAETVSGVSVTATNSAGEATTNAAGFEIVGNDETAFITTWETTATSESITLPADASAGSNDFTVDWGDGTLPEAVTAANPSHVYANPGIYDVSVIGTCPAWKHDKQGDYLKIKKIKQCGDVGFTGSGLANGFRGCANLVWEATDILQTGNLTSLAWTFAECSLLAPNLEMCDVSSLTSLNGTFQDAPLANPNVANWNAPLMANMVNMGRRASSWNPDISNWPVTNLTNATDALEDSAFSNENYDAFLVSAAAQSVQNGVVFDAGNAVYTEVTAKDTLETTYSWVFTDGGQASTPSETLSYPITFGMYQTHTAENDPTDPTVQADVARNDIVVYGLWRDWNSGDFLTPMNAIRTLGESNKNGGTIIFKYVNNTSVRRTDDVAKQDIIDKVNAEDWYLRDAAGEKVFWTTAYDAWALNYGSYMSVDADGKSLNDWLSDRDITEFFSDAAFDGVFADNCFKHTRVIADWNIDGIDDAAHDDTNLAAIINRLGYADWMNQFATKIPAKTIITNTDSDLDYDEFRNKFQGGFIEGAIGKPYSVETWSTWENMMDWYYTLFDTLVAPGYVLFHNYETIYDGQDYHYDLMRYGLCSCLMNDGYYSSDWNYGDTTHYEEYDLDLGQPVDTPPVLGSGAQADGTYKREFDNGVAIVNPKGNTTVTIDIVNDYPGFKRFLGTEDAVRNDGTTDSFSLPVRDGVILVSV